MILVVDDSVEIVNWLREVIEQAGYFYDSATDANMALYKASRIYYSMAIIDIIMPGMGGDGLAKAIKDLPKPFCHTPLVAMTGGLVKDENQHLFAAVLHKPFLPRDVRTIIAQHARPPIKDLHVVRAAAG